MKKSKTKNIFRGLLALFCTVIAAAVMFAVAPEVMAHGISYFTSNADGLTLALTPALVTRFAKDAEEKMYPNNEFYKNSVDDSQYLDGKTVRRPVSGDDPSVQTNPTAFPLTMSERADDSSDYDIDFFTTEPQFVRVDEEMQTNYNKRQSIIAGHTKVLNVKIADNFAYTWAPVLAANMVRTTGAAATATAPGATGNRLKLTKEDFLSASAILDEANVPESGRFAVVPSKMYSQMLGIADFVDYTKTGRQDMLAKGLIGEVLGIQIYKRSRVVVYTDAGTPVKKAPGAATATTDNQAILIWHESMVYRAEGKVKVTIDNPSTLLAGASAFNAQVFAGGRNRADELGVVAIIQTT